MSVCRLAMLSFCFGDKRDLRKRLYSRNDLIDTSAYCQGLIEEGYSREPHDNFDLREFIEWANVENNIPPS